MEDSDDKQIGYEQSQEAPDLKEMVLKQEEIKNILIKSTSNVDITSTQPSVKEDDEKSCQQAANRLDTCYNGDDDEKENDINERSNKGTTNEEIIDGFSFLSFDTEAELKQIFEARKQEYNLTQNNLLAEKTKKNSKKHSKNDSFQRQKSSSSTSTASTSKATTKQTKSSRIQSSSTNSNSSFISNDEDHTNDGLIFNGPGGGVDSNSSHANTTGNPESLSTASNDLTQKMEPELKEEHCETVLKAVDNQEQTETAMNIKNHSHAGKKNIEASTDSFTSSKPVTTVPSSCSTSNHHNQQQPQPQQLPPFMLPFSQDDFNSHLRANFYQNVQKGLHSDFINKNHEQNSMINFMDIHGKKPSNTFNPHLPGNSPHINKHNVNPSTQHKQANQPFTHQNNKLFGSGQTPSPAEIAYLTSLLGNGQLPNLNNLPASQQQIFAELIKSNPHINENSHSVSPSKLSAHVEHQKHLFNHVQKPADFYKQQLQGHSEQPFSINSLFNRSNNSAVGDQQFMIPGQENSYLQRQLQHQKQQQLVTQQQQQQIHKSNHYFNPNTAVTQAKKVNQHTNHPKPRKFSPLPSPNSNSLPRPPLSLNTDPKIDKNNKNFGLTESQAQLNRQLLNSSIYNSSNPFNSFDQTNNQNRKGNTPNGVSPHLNKSTPKPNPNVEMFGGPYSQSQNAPNLAESSHLNHFSQPNNNLNSQYKPQNNLKNSFSIAQMAASTQQQQSHNIPGMPSFGPFDPMNPDFLRRELDSRFLQQLIGNQSSSPLLPNSMLPPPPAAFMANMNNGSFPMMPAGLTGMKANDKDKLNAMNEQHQMMMMQQFFRNSFPGLIPPVPGSSNMHQSNSPNRPPSSITPSTKVNNSSPRSSSSKENTSWSHQPSFSSNNVTSLNGQPKHLPPHLLPSFSPFSNKTSNTFSHSNRPSSRSISPKTSMHGQQQQNKWCTAHVKIAHMIMSHQSQKKIDPTLHRRTSSHEYQLLKPSASNKSKQFNDYSSQQLTFNTSPTNHSNPKHYAKAAQAATSNTVTSSASTFYPPIQASQTHSLTAYGGLASLQPQPHSAQKSQNLTNNHSDEKFRHSTNPNSQSSGHKSLKKSQYSSSMLHNHRANQSSSSSDKSRQRSRSRSPVSIKTNRPHNNQPIPPANKHDPMMSPNHLATEAAITAYAQFMMADKHRQDMLRLSTPVANKNTQPTMPLMPPFMPGMPMLGQVPPVMSHNPLNLPPLPFQTQQQPPALSPKSLQAKLMQSFSQMPPNMTETDFMRMITAGMPMLEQSKATLSHNKSPSEHGHSIQQFLDTKEAKYKRESPPSNELNVRDSAKRHKKFKHSHGLSDNMLNKSIASDDSSEVFIERKESLNSPLIESKQERTPDIVNSNSKKEIIQPEDANSQPERSNDSSTKQIAKTEACTDTIRAKDEVNNGDAEPRDEISETEVLMIFQKE